MKKLFKRLFKSAFFSWLIVFLAANYIRLAYYTSFRHMEVDESAKPYLRGELQAVFAFWHGRMLLMPMVCPPGHKMQVLISTHRDGEMIARTMHRFGFGTPRGSSTRGGVTAAMQAVKALQAGDNVAITPDGPKGPAMKVQPGLLSIASMANVPVVPVTYSSSLHKRMKTWDRFMIALPFGRVYYRIGAPMMNATAEALEAEMVCLTQEVDIKADIT
jgi:lysophospholipid acyltransferase (LPLAT)-like uncharacterized protein